MLRASIERMTFFPKVPAMSARIARAIGVSIIVCASGLPGCNRNLPRLLVSEQVGAGVNTDTAEYRNGSRSVVSRVEHYYNSPTGEHSEAGDFTAVFRAMTGKELAEPGAVRSVSALLSALEKEGVKLTDEPRGKVEDNPLAPGVRAFTVQP